MTAKIIPVQGTFDIAKGRHTLRSFIISEKLPHYFIIRAVALLTTMGEMILIVNGGQRIPIFFDVNRDQCGDVTVQLSCELVNDHIDERYLTHIEQRLGVTSDKAEIAYKNNLLSIETNLFLSHVALT